MVDRKKWYAVYTKPRWEKKIHQLLANRGIESYCPVNKVRRQWSDRIKLVSEPLFKSYVFVRLAEDEKATVRITNGVVNFVYWLGKPAIVKDKDIETIKRFLLDYEYIVAEPLDIATNDTVKVTRGLLMDVDGKVLKVTRKKAQVLLNCIGYKLVAYVDKQNLKVLK